MRRRPQPLIERIAKIDIAGQPEAQQQHGPIGQQLAKVNLQPPPLQRRDKNYGPVLTVWHGHR
ncbi:hypothetical protein GCM10011617_24070 [Novosphingobium arvoryzae]|uniref:Uncharacterized protein n=1 Tax=Novosphingobium arvoryzae TaxID=1256514 RepID=A0A918RNU1_9SPHN|nr:hypothetical protein GCM10011617_24070 [Novosphingobium arvoryzae]